MVRLETARFICNIPTFPLAARRFSRPGFSSSGGVGDEINRNWRNLNQNNKIFIHKNNNTNWYR